MLAFTVILFKRMAKKHANTEETLKAGIEPVLLPLCFSFPPTLNRLDAALMLMRATDSRFRLGKRLYPERWLVKEMSEATPGVTGPP